MSVTLELPSGQRQKKKREPDNSLHDFFLFEKFKIFELNETNLPFIKCITLS